MDLMEYQAKELFARHGVPVTLGRVIEDPADAAAAAEELGGRVVVKGVERHGVVAVEVAIAGVGFGMEDELKVGNGARSLHG